MEKTLKLKRMISVFAIICITTLFLCGNASASQNNWFSSTTAANKEKYFYNVTGTLKNYSYAFSYVKGTIVNNGVPTEFFSGKFGSATAPRTECGHKSFYTTSPTFNNATVKAGIYRDSGGTTMDIEVRALVE